MKQLIIITLILAASITVNAQSKHKADTSKKVKPDTTRKVYTLFLQVDSLTFMQVQNNIAKVSNHLEASTAPHNEVQADQLFLKQLYQLFESEYKDQRKKK